jgi:hypothetical protein
MKVRKAMSAQLTGKQIAALAEGAFVAGVAVMNIDGDATESERDTIIKVVVGWDSRSEVVTAVTEHIKSEMRNTSGFKYNFDEKKQALAKAAYQTMSDADKYRYLWFVEQITMNVAAASGGNLSGQPVSEAEMNMGAFVMSIISGTDLDVPAYRAYIDSAGA